MCIGSRKEFLTGLTGLPGLKMDLSVEKPRRFPGSAHGAFGKRLTISGIL